MNLTRRMALSVAVVAALLLAAGVAAAQAPSSTDPPIISWQPPSSYSMAPAPGFTKYSTTVGVGPAPFYPIVPCRQYDSRSSSALADNTPRSVTLTGAPCGVPGGTWALAVNITVFSITGAGSNGVFKVGTASPPTTAWINYPPTETQRGNAGVVATNGSAIWVQINQGAGSVHFTVDVYGYYYNGLNASPWDMTTGDMFSIIGSKDGYPIIFGRNNSTAANSHGVVGRSYSTGSGSAGVWGDEVGATGVVYGVKGITSSTTSGAAGVYGQSTAATGVSYGVLGRAASSTSDIAAIRGELTGASAGTGLGGSYIPAGVRGESNEIGVFGLSNYLGVIGRGQTTSGSWTGTGYLGYNGGATTYAVYGVPGSAGTTNWAVYAAGNMGASGTKPFVEPHPYRPDMVIRYVALEGPEAGTYFRGRGRFVDGMAVIEVPEDFRLVTDGEGLSIQVTPIGDFSQVAVVSLGLEFIELKSTRDVEFFYHVNGVRRTFKDWKVMVQGTEFMPDGPTATMPSGLSEEQKRSLIQNGTYNEDGTVNLATARRLGWEEEWSRHPTRSLELFREDVKK